MAKKKGFTLIELIIVIAIIAVLGTAAFLVLTEWLGKSRDSRRLSDISTLNTAMNVYFTQQEGALDLYNKKTDAFVATTNLDLSALTGKNANISFQGALTDTLFNALGMDALQKNVKDPKDVPYVMAVNAGALGATGSLYNFSATREFQGDSTIPSAIVEGNFAKRPYNWGLPGETVNVTIDSLVVPGTYGTNKGSEATWTKATGVAASYDTGTTLNAALVKPGDTTNLPYSF